MNSAPARSPGPAVWFAGPREVELRSETPPRPEAGEVLLRTRRTLISSGTELSLLAGGPPGTVWHEIADYPRRSGYSHVGEVEDVGPGVDRSWIGRRVASRRPHAAWIAAPADDLRPVPDAVSDEEATFSTLAGVVMNGLRRARLAWGESVAVFGLGLVGQLTARIAATAGAGPVFGLDRDADRIRRLPPSEPFVALRADDPETLPDAVRERNHGRRVDLVVEATAAAGLIPRELSLVRDQGRMLLLSSPRRPTEFDFHDLCNRRSLTLVGAHGFSQPSAATPDHPWTSRRNAELFLDWLRAERLEVAGLVTHRLPGERAAEAYELLRRRKEGQGEDVLGVVLSWD